MRFRSGSVSSVKPHSDFVCGGVVVGSQAAQITMPQHPRQVKNIQFAGKAGAGFVPRVVEGKIMDSSPDSGLSEKLRGNLW